MFVQYFTPADVRTRIRGPRAGGAERRCTTGHSEKARWAHYYVQEGYRCTWSIRPGHGRAPYHPDALGPIGGNVSYAAIAGDTRRAAVARIISGPETGDNAIRCSTRCWPDRRTPQDNASRIHVGSRGAELLERIGPSIVQCIRGGRQLDRRERAAESRQGDHNVEAAPAVRCRHAVGLTDVPGLRSAGVRPVNRSRRVMWPDRVARPTSCRRSRLANSRIWRHSDHLCGCRKVRPERRAGGGLPETAGVDAEEFNLKDNGILGNGHS